MVFGWVINRELVWRNTNPLKLFVWRNGGMCFTLICKYLVMYIVFLYTSSCLSYWENDREWGTPDQRRWPLSAAGHYFGQSNFSGYFSATYIQYAIQFRYVSNNINVYYTHFYFNIKQLSMLHQNSYPPNTYLSYSFRFYI